MQLKGGAEKSEQELDAEAEAAASENEDDLNSSNDINDESGVRSEMAGVSSSCPQLFFLHPPVLVAAGALVAAAFAAHGLI